MKRSPQVFMAAAALVMCLSLTGCGIPAFVTANCQMSLSGVMAEASTDGLNTVRNSCASTFVALDKINQCVYEGQRTLSEAKQQTLPDFAEQCAKYVEQTVCNADSKCYKAPDKITPAMALPAITQFVTVNGNDLKIRMKSVMDAKIHEIVTADYDSKYRNRAVPLTVQAQCGNELDKELGMNPDISNDPIKEIYRRCERFDRGFQQNDCQTAALNKLQQVQREEKNKFKERCARAALSKACPKGSACGLETSGANTEVTGQAAVNFMWNNFGLWKTTFKNTLMNTASGWTYWGRKYSIFPHALIGTDGTGFWQGSTLLAMTGIAASMGGLGCAVAAVRFARRRSATPEEIPEAVELIEDVEESLDA